MRMILYPRAANGITCLTLGLTFNRAQLIIKDPDLLIITNHSDHCLTPETNDQMET